MGPVALRNRITDYSHLVKYLSRIATKKNTVFRIGPIPGIQMDARKGVSQM